MKQLAFLRRVILFQHNTGFVLDASARRLLGPPSYAKTPTTETAGYGGPFVLSQSVVFRGATPEDWFVAALDMLAGTCPFGVLGIGANSHVYIPEPCGLVATSSRNGTGFDAREFEVKTEVGSPIAYDGPNILASIGWGWNQWEDTGGDWDFIVPYTEPALRWRAEVTGAAPAKTVQGLVTVEGRLYVRIPFPAGSAKVAFTVGGNYDNAYFSAYDYNDNHLGSFLAGGEVTLPALTYSLLFNIENPLAISQPVLNVTAPGLANGLRPGLFVTCQESAIGVDWGYVEPIPPDGSGPVEPVTCDVQTVQLAFKADNHTANPIKLVI